MKNQLENTELNRHRIETEFNLGNKPKSDYYEILAQKSHEEQMLAQAENSWVRSKTSLMNLLNLKEEVDFEGEEKLISTWDKKT